jgi:hypothetical protein
MTYKIIRETTNKDNESVFYEHGDYKNFQVAQKFCKIEESKFKAHSPAALQSGRVLFYVMEGNPSNFQVNPPKRKKGTQPDIFKGKSKMGGEPMNEGRLKDAATIAAGAAWGASGGYIAGGPIGAVAGGIGGAYMGHTINKDANHVENFSKYLDDDIKHLKKLHPVGKQVDMHVLTYNHPKNGPATITKWHKSGQIDYKSHTDGKIYTGETPYGIKNHGSKYFGEDGYEKPEFLDKNKNFI